MSYTHSPEYLALVKERLAALRAISDHDLLIKAADLIANDPIIANGSYREMYTSNRLALLGVAVEPNASIACHCLEGAIREAAGIYVITNVGSSGFSELYDVVIEFDHRRLELEKAVVAQFDRDKLGKLLDDWATVDDIPTLAQIEAGELYYAPGVIYLYSDNVLSALGTDGPKEAERILRAAAASLASKED